MKILGIDPGYARLGYGIVESDGNKYRAVDYGVIETGSELEFFERLSLLYEGLMLLAEEHGPDLAGVEELFFAKNQKTAINVAQARGVALLACVNSGVEIRELTPLQVKQGLTGYGVAEKDQVKYMVKTILGLGDMPKLDDATDALAVAICCSHYA
jgi:crossover junction endodeoxyribonuclease RuvC